MTIDEHGTPVLARGEEEAAATVRMEIDIVLSTIQSSETSLASNYIKLGLLLSEIKQNKYWLMWNYESFGDYIDSVRETIHRGRTQLYHIISVTETLLPQVGKDFLQEIGVTKAIALKKYISTTGKQLPQELIEFAKNEENGVEELKAEVFKTSNPTSVEYKGTYFDFGGCYLEDEELKTVKQAINTAMRVDPIISKELPEYARRKEVLLRFAMEFISSNAQEAWLASE